MRSYHTLPEGYREIYALDMHEDKKLAVWVNLLSLAIAAVFAVPMLFVVPWWATFDVTNGMTGMRCERSRGSVCGACRGGIRPGFSLLHVS